MQTFNISYKDVFGVVYHHDLKVIRCNETVKDPSD